MTLSEYFAAAHGNQQRLADAIGAHNPDISRWASGIRCTPLKYGTAIERATGGAVTRKDLFPDTWASIWPELASTTPAADEPLRTRMLELAGEVAAAKVQAARDATEHERKNKEFYSLLDELGAVKNRNRELEQQVLALFGPAGAQVDHAAELRAAILQTRHVFEGQPGAADVIEYLEQVLAAGAPVRTQTGTTAGLPVDYIDLIVTTGRVDASIEKESLAAVGAVPVVVEKNAADQAASSTADQADAEAPATIIAKLAVDIDTSAITVALAMIEQLAQAVSSLAELDGLCASITGSLSAANTTAADRAAAAMAAESAQLVIQAEKAAASAAARAAVDPLALLSREVFSLSDKLQQPVDLVVQLLVLAELRGTRADRISKHFGFGVTRS